MGTYRADPIPHSQNVSIPTSSLLQLRLFFVVVAHSTESQRDGSVEETLDRWFDIALYLNL